RCCHLKNIWTAPLPPETFFFRPEAAIRNLTVTGVQTCALPISVLLCDLAVGYPEEHGVRAGRRRAASQRAVDPEAGGSHPGGERSEERRVGKECRLPRQM